jgi:hypothetical protein
MEKPIVMISSTCFDLKQIRNELRSFIDNIGYEVILSESYDFPVNPDIDAIENCKDKVGLYADIMIVIIGGRYGSIQKETGKSITNIEYIEAKQKGIPIYILVESKILSCIDVWNKNKDGNYSGIVDSTKLFEFVDSIRNSDSNWVFPFDVVSDIKTIITNQFAYLFKLSLITSAKIKKNHDAIYNGISNTAFKLIIEKQKAWEYKLFYQVWIDELEKIDDKIYEWMYNINYSSTLSINKSNIVEWSNLKLKEISLLAENTEVLFSETRTISAFGPIGCPGNIKEIIISAKTIVKTLIGFINWSLNVRSVHIDEELKDVVYYMARFPECIIKNILEFPSKALDEIGKAVIIATTENPIRIEQTIKIELAYLKEFEDAMIKAKEKLSTDYSD